MSSVVIIVDSSDITDAVIFSSASFDQQFGGVAGTFSITVRDPDRTLSFATGVEMSLDIDGQRMFGGYVTQVSMGHQAPAADTNDLDTYQLRTWTLRGSDYNIIFDKRVARRTSDYLTYITLSGPSDGEILTDLVDNYSDCSDFTTTGITNITNPPGDGNDVIAQGTKLRVEFANMSFFGGAVWYIDGNKNFIYVPFEDVEKRWGFSDQPNHDGITASPASFQGSTIGFRQVEAQEDGTYIVNDALIWGGSAFAGTSGGTVFARAEDATSQSTYGRWQIAEAHFGEKGYQIQDGVDARADVIVNGPPGADIYGQQKGLRYSQWQFQFTWFSTDVPTLSGVPDHLTAGDIVTIEMNVFGVTKLLPLRTLRTSFPDALLGADPAGRVVQFDGTFGLQLSDPFTLWHFILNNQTRAAQQVSNTPSAVNDSDTVTVYGALGQFQPTPATDNSTVLFGIPFGYIPGTLQVYQGTTGGSGAALLQWGVDFTETDNEAGTFTMTVAPPATDYLLVVCYTLAS
jgi:hypothetical protein